MPAAGYAYALCRNSALISSTALLQRASEPLSGYTSQILLKSRILSLIFSDR
jgi:hypothetical protein